MLFRVSRLMPLLLVTTNVATSSLAFDQAKQIRILPFPVLAVDPQGVLPSSEATLARSREAAVVSIEFPLNQIAEISPAVSAPVAFGDTDHDGWNEVILRHRNVDLTVQYQILEHLGNDAYSIEYSGTSLIPYAAGDLDQDFKAEIIGQRGFSLEVYESLDSTSYPTELVWSSPALSNFTGYTTVGDTDRDGRMEIIHSVNTLGNSSLVIYENTANDTYTLVHTENLSRGSGEKVIADLDGDGLVEIALSALDSVYILESPADNVWELTWSDATGLNNSSAAEGGRDTDGNGTPELFIMGNGPSGWTTVVYEAVGDNAFASVDTFAVADGFGGFVFNALGNLDGVGADEYVMQGVCCLWIYQATTPGSWELVQEITDPSLQHNGLHIYDVNRNRRDELFWIGPDSTLVLEHPGDPTSVQIQPRPMVSLFPFPNPTRVQASLGIELVHERSPVLAVFNVAGRLVERRTLTRDTGGRLLWPVQHLRSGVYVLRLENRSGTTLAVGRGTVVR